MNNTERGGKTTRALLAGMKSLYFVGICGISMSGLARMARAAEWRVRGCDRANGSREAHLLFREGIAVEPEKSATLGDAEAVIYTAAISEDSPAIAEALARGIPLISRADFLAALMEPYESRIVVAGMHGKSTTVGMLAAILTEAGRNPTVSCGAPLAPGEPAYRLGGNQIFLAEGCEYRDSFLSLSPTLAVVTNIDLDHPDYFPDLGAVKSSFLQFLAASDQRVLGGDCRALLDIAPCGAVLFGFSPYADVRGQMTDRGFEVWDRENCLGTLFLSLPGAYNRQNALAAVAAGLRLGIPFAVIQKALRGFRGVGRRMESCGTFLGARVYLDYAHHPTEMTAAIRGIQEDGARVLCIFQPHTFTRTRALWDDFIAALKLPDRACLLDIYPAREPPLPGITSCRLSEEAGISYAPDFSAALTWAKENARTGDTLLLMGAGDIDGLVRLLDGSESK